MRSIVFADRKDKIKRKSKSNIDVSFAIDTNGLPRVSALDLDNGEPKEITGITTGNSNYPADVQLREWSRNIHSHQ